MNQVSVQFAPVPRPLSPNFGVIRLFLPDSEFSSLGKPYAYGGSVTPPVFGHEYPLRFTMSGSGDIQSREWSIITWQTSSDMGCHGFVRKTNKQNNINIRSNSKKRAIPMKRVHSISTKSSLYYNNSPPPPHPQKQTNKQNLSCCLLYCNFYS